MTSFESVNAWVEQQLAASTGASSLLFLFLGGLLASLLPCVYPLYPITIAILRNRESRFGRFAHPITYYLGLALTYGAFGIVAASTGGAFNGILRHPAANLFIGALLVVLGLATTGLLHFPILLGGADESNSRRGLAQTFSMGATAGLLSSACVGPVVVSILVGLAAGAGSATIGAAAVASAKMLVFGLGVGTPILLVGVFGVTLPRGGRWMVAIQWAFGALIVAFALGYVDKGLVGAGLSTGAAQGAIFGAAVIAVASFLLQADHEPHPVRSRRSLLTVAAISGALVMARSVLGTSHTFASAPAEGGNGEAATTQTSGDLTWYVDPEAAYRAAAQSGRPVFVDFFGTWCTNCRAFETLTHEDQALHAALRNAVLLKVYDTSPAFAAYREDPRFPELRVGLPFFVVTSPSREVLYKTNDYSRTDEMVLFLSHD